MNREKEGNSMREGVLQKYVELFRFGPVRKNEVHIFNTIP